MAKSTKTNGYRIQIDAFIEADLADIGTLQAIQKMAQDAAACLGAEVKPVITPTRR